MIFNQIDKVEQLDLFQAVRFQIVTHCFLHNIELSTTELDCLTLLGCRGKMRIGAFCILAAELKILGKKAAVNNCLARIEQSKLFLKEGAGKKYIYLNPKLGIQTKGNIILKYKFVCVDEQAGTLEANSQANGAATKLA